MTLSTPEIKQSGNNYYVQHGTDANLYVTFYMESVYDEEASLKEGRPIYVDKEYVKIIPAGDKNTVVCRPVDLKGKGIAPPDNIRWPNQYAAFKNQQVQVQEGTPLEQWPPLTKSQVMEFKAANVHTIEQLATVSDVNLQNLGMGARKFRDLAITYIDDAKKSAGYMQAQKEIEELKGQVEALKNQLSGLGTPKKEKKNGKNTTTDGAASSE